MDPANGGNIFNNDLLANEGDLKIAQDLYAPVLHAFYHKELIDYFAKYNEPANDAKMKSTRYGMWAIALGALVLALAAAEIIMRSIDLPHEWSLAMGGIAATCGLASIAVAGLGVLYGDRKIRWLKNRFMGERLRQLHFQSLVALLPLIIASAQDEAKKAELDAARRKLLANFAVEFDDRLDDDLVDDRFRSAIGPNGDKEFWLIKIDETTAIPEGPELKMFFDAYRDLRIEHQLSYAEIQTQEG
jgi:hypothetical protein